MKNKKIILLTIPLFVLNTTHRVDIETNVKKDVGLLPCNFPKGGWSFGWNAIRIDNNQKIKGVIHYMPEKVSKPGSLAISHDTVTEQNMDYPVQKNFPQNSKAFGWDGATNVVDFTIDTSSRPEFVPPVYLKNKTWQSGFVYKRDDSQNKDFASFDQLEIDKKQIYKSPNGVIWGLSAVNFESLGSDRWYQLGYNTKSYVYDKSYQDLENMVKSCS